MMENVRHLRVADEGDIPHIVPARYADLSDKVLGHWLDKEEETTGRHLIGSYYWEFPHDPQNKAAAAIGRLLVSVCRNLDPYEDIDFSTDRLRRGSLGEKSSIGLLGLASQAEIEIEAANAIIVSLAHAANAWLEDLSSPYRVPILDQSTDTSKGA
jgi:hypothetical protein